MYKQIKVLYIPNESTINIKIENQTNVEDESENEELKVQAVEAENQDVPTPKRKNKKKKKKKKKAAHPSTSETAMASLENRNSATAEKIKEDKDTVNMKINQATVNVTENVAAIPGPSTGIITKIPIPNIKIEKENLEDKSGNEKSKIKNAEAKNVKNVPTTESKNMKRKAVHLPTSEMVMNSIEALKMSEGATSEDIKKHMEETYLVNMKMMKRHVDNFLQKSVGNGLLEKIDVNVELRFKIKRSEEPQKKPAKKVIASKKKKKAKK